MRLRKGVVQLAVLVPVLAGLLWRIATSPEDLGTYSPVRYVQKANELIRKGALSAECSNWPRITLDEGKLSPEDLEWYKASYLPDDIERFNRDPQRYGRTFLLDSGCRLRAIASTIHDIRLPFSETVIWSGRILLANRGGGGQLSSTERTILLRSPEQSSTVNDEIPTEIGSRQGLDSPFVLLHFPGGESHAAAFVQSAGPHAILDNRIAGGYAGDSVRLLGYRLPEGRVVALANGDWVGFSSREPRDVSETFVYTGDVQGAVVSSLGLRNDRPMRVSEGADLGWLPDVNQAEGSSLIDGVARSIDRAISRGALERARDLAGSFDLQLTVDRRLQRELGGAFHQYCRSVRDTRKMGRNFPAGLTVMDGRTGNLLALVTFPLREDFSEGRLEASVDARSRGNLLRNQNFVRHPIGSAGKPFFFAAIATAHPFLMGLQIEGHPSEESRQDLLHCWLPSGYQDFGHAGPVDFATALEASCNRYTLELALLALAARPGATLEQRIPRAPGVVWPRPGRSSGVQIGGTQLTWAPRIEEYVKGGDLPNRLPVPTMAVQTCARTSRMEQVSFASPFEKLTGVSTYLGTEPDVGAEATEEEFYRSYFTQRYNLTPWSSLVQFLAKEGSELEVAGALAEVSPEQVNVGLNHVFDLRSDYVSLLLGGGDHSSWTNIQLAASMARLVTNQPIEARLVERVIRKEAETAGELPAVTPAGPVLPAEVQRTVLEGLRRVAEGDRGTARKHILSNLERLRGRHPDRDIFFFSKTGSPRILRPVPAFTGTALRRLTDVLVIEAGEIRLPQGPAYPSDRDGFRKAMATEVQRMGFKGPPGPIVENLERIFRRLHSRLRVLSWGPAEEIPGEIPSPVYIIGNRLRLNEASNLFRQGLDEDDGSVYVFSLVSCPKRSSSGSLPSVEQLQDPRTRILTGALHLEVGPNSSVAVQAVRDLLPILEPLLE